MTNKRNLPAKPAKGDFLAKIRAGKVDVALKKSKPLARANEDALIAAALNTQRPRLVFAADATGSRAASWDIARPLTARLFDALPGELDIALAVHGGDRLHTFTEFSSDKAAFKKIADRVQCKVGRTRLVSMMDRTAEKNRVKVLLYIGDAFEESEYEATLAAKSLKAKGCRMIIMQDNATRPTLEVFHRLADITGGAVLDFHPSQADALGDILQAVAILAAKGLKALQGQAKELPAAALLLQHIKSDG